jgi:2-polyprenyl-3-methyl-5-hydroxy-6-metoxy-1,4-benzoquinol methylase
MACGTAMRPHLHAAGFAVHRCPACGLGRTLLPEGFDVAGIYDESYFQGGQADGYADYQGSRAELSLEFRQVVRLLQAGGPGGGRLLEIGCAYGFFLDEAAGGFDVYGVELAEHARQSCRARGLRVAARLDDAGVLAGAPYDAVVMLDVIEHLPDPAGTLLAVAGMLRPGGRLVLTTGDFGALTARALGARWRLMTPPQHLWFFTVAALGHCLRSAGFELVSTTHPAKRVPLSLLVYQLGRMLGRGNRWRLNLGGSVPVNLFDAMRIVARRSGA